MSQPTKAIAVRVPRAVHEQVEKLVAAQNITISDWVRDLIMQALYDAGLLASGQSPAKQNTPNATVHAIDSRIVELPTELRNEIAGLKASIDELAKKHHQDLITLAQVGLNVEELMEERIDAACGEVLDAIARLKQAQRSHKDTLLRAIHQT